MNTVLFFVHWVCGLIVLTEALNKLERTDLFDGRIGLATRLAALGWLFVPWRWRQSRVVMALKLNAWALLALGGGSAIAAPFMGLAKPSLPDVAVIAGFALLILRSRLKEACPMKLSVQRTHTVGDRTFGRMTADGVFLCYTLEDAVREIPGRPVDEWKVHGVTAIPSGQYRVTLELSPKFGPDTLTINSVPGFSGVRMHAGNTAEDTEGCILLGTRIQDAGIVGGTSRPAVDLVTDTVRQAIHAGKIVTIEVGPSTVPAEVAT